MAGPQLTIGDLFKAKEVTEADLETVTVGWIEDRIEGLIPIGQHRVDIAKAVAASEHATRLLGRTGASPSSVQGAVQSAILRAAAEPAPGS